MPSPLDRVRVEERELDRVFDERGNWRTPVPLDAPARRLPASGAFAQDFGAALATLRPEQSKAFVLREVEGLAPHEVCARLGIAESDFPELMFRARLAMLRALGARDAHDG